MAIAPFRVRRMATHLRAIDTMRRSADSAIAEDDVRELITHLTAIAHEATLALGELARPPRSLRDGEQQS